MCLGSVSIVFTFTHLPSIQGHFWPKSPGSTILALPQRAADRTTEGPGVDIRPIYDSLKEELGEIEGLAQSILQLRSQEEIMEKRERISGQSVRLPELALASDMDGAIARVKQLLQISLKERVSVRPR